MTKHSTAHIPVRASQVALVVTNQPANAGDKRDVGSFPGSGRSPGGGRGNPLQYVCLENSVDRGAWQAIVHRVAKGQTGLKKLRMHTYTCEAINTTKIMDRANTSQCFLLPLYCHHCHYYYSCMWRGHLTHAVPSGGSDGKESGCNARDLIPGSGRSPGEGHGNPLQYSCLENSMNRGAWWATVHGVAKNWTWLTN